MARTTTEGGTTSGYSLIGSANIASPPARKMTIDSTLAKIGRSMKNLEKLIARSSASAGGGGRSVGHRGRRVGVHRRHRGGHLHPGAHPLQAVHHDPLAGRDPLLHDAEPVDQPPDLDRPVLHRAVRLEDQHELLVLVGADGAVLDQ